MVQITGRLELATAWKPGQGANKGRQNNKYKGPNLILHPAPKLASPQSSWHKEQVFACKLSDNFKIYIHDVRHGLRLAVQDIAPSGTPFETFCHFVPTWFFSCDCSLSWLSLVPSHASLVSFQAFSRTWGKITTLIVQIRKEKAHRSRGLALPISPSPRPLDVARLG